MIPSAQHTKRALTHEERQVRKWVLENRGVMRRIAQEHEVSLQFVHLIAYGRSTARLGHPVERSLRDAGWMPPLRTKGKRGGKN